jgi:diguanylate cyclase (GGDEF)-like protein
MKIANVLEIHSRFADSVFRLEGANFAVIMPGTDDQGGLFESERLRVVINQTEYIDESLLKNTAFSGRIKKQESMITASLGVATYPCERPLRNETELIGLAKKALSQAKTTGKNKTVSAADLL